MAKYNSHINVPYNENEIASSGSVFYYIFSLHSTYCIEIDFNKLKVLKWCHGKILKCFVLANTVRKAIKPQFRYCGNLL